MKQNRRDLFITAAQVAFHFGYTLADALALSSSERYLLLAVVADIEDKKYAKLGKMLGTRWSVEDLIEESKQGSSDLPDEVNFPLLPFVAPDLFQTMAKDYRTKALAAKRNRAMGGVTEVGTLNVKDAKAFFKSLNLGSSDPKG